MSIRRFITALLAAALMASLTAAPAAAKRPLPATPDAEPPLTPEQQAASDAKVATAEAYAAQAAASGADLASLSCISPQGTTTEDSATPMAGCITPSGALGVTARDQIKSYYCGPAVGQVIANYAWAMPSGSNKYSQTTIAGWMGTDVRFSTSAGDLVYGLERATAGSPRRPANWAWVVTMLTDTDGDGTVGDQLHAYVRSSISGSKMPLAFAVKPHDRNSRYHLSSWPKAVDSVGHWITGYGWYALWTNNDTPRIYYTDSSKDEGGSTGKFWDPTRHIAALIMEHTKRFVW
jgi:hypothetical protein